MTGPTLKTTASRTAVAVKLTDNSVTSNAVLANDPDLTIPVKKGETWLFTAWLVMTFGATGGMQFAVTAPASSTGVASAVDHTHAATNANGAFSSGTAITNEDTQTSAFVECRVSLTIGTDGNVVFQFAQKTSNGTASLLKAGSSVIAHRVN